MKHIKPYFSHDEGARKDPKLINVMMKLGHEGKSLYWDVVEMLYEQGGFLLLAEYPTYAFDLRTSEKVLKSLVSDFGLFKKDRQRFWSQAVLDRMELRNEKAKKRAEAGSKGGKAKAEKVALLQQTQSIATANAEQTHGNALASKVNESKEKEQASLPADSFKEVEYHWDECPVFKAGNFKEFVKSIGYPQVEWSAYLLRIGNGAQEAVNARRRPALATEAKWKSFIQSWLDNDRKNSNLLLAQSQEQKEAQPGVTTTDYSPQALAAANVVKY